MAERPSRKILRHRLEKQLARQQEESRKELLRKRIEIAKEGVALYGRGQVIGATRKYMQYIVICEMWKKSGRGGLGPEHFDSKKDLFELVLISGIYWDFAKLYDRSKNPAQKADLRIYLQKYVNFSKGFPYAPLAKEALRRYLNSGKANHVEEFRTAYMAMGGGKCFVAHALLRELEMSEISTLQLYRDRVLKSSLVGRSFISLYYRLSPPLAVQLARLPAPVRRVIARIIVRPVIRHAARVLT